MAGLRQGHAFGRCIFLHTTFIPYREFERVLGIHGIDDECSAEIREYLDLLDLTVDIEVASLQRDASRHVMTAIAQPGLRYAQADALIESLLRDPTFADVAPVERGRIIERIRTEIKGRMMEEVVLLETKLARPACEVFKLQFDVGEIDMVVFDMQHGFCELYEVKHSDARVPQQRRHLLDGEKCAQIAAQYGNIVKKCVIYRGEDASEQGVPYLNVEGYLKSLGECEHTKLNQMSSGVGGSSRHGWWKCHINRPGLRENVSDVIESAAGK